MEPDRKRLEAEENGTHDDPVVTAYRAGGPKAAQGFVRVRGSEVTRDPNLYSLAKAAKSLGFNGNSSLNQRSKPRLPANPYVEQKIRHMLMAEEIKRRVRDETITFESLAGDLDEIRSIDDPAAQKILTLVTNQLIIEGLWRDEDKDLTMSEAFPLSQAQEDRQAGTHELDAIEYGTFLEDADITHEDRAAPSLASEVTAHSKSLRLPTLATPMLHNLMRASPRDLFHQIARRMIDSHYFEDHPENSHLYIACYFASKGVEVEDHFHQFMRAGLSEELPHYTFQQFRFERVALRKLIRTFITGFFAENPAIKRRLSLRTEPDKRDYRNVWTRFAQVWNGLTAKQKEALEAVYMNEERLTREEAAKAFGITVDSLNSRIRTAVQDFKREFWEFEGMSPKRLPRKSLAGALTHNNLWRYQSAACKSPLYRVDLKTEVKAEIEWRKLPKSRNLDWKTQAQIKAEIIANCPVPYFHETEYFDGMLPTFISIERKQTRKNK